MITRFFKSVSGSGSIEYALLSGAIGIAVMTGVTSMEPTSKNDIKEIDYVVVSGVTE